MRQQPLQPISPSIDDETGLAGGSVETGRVIEPRISAEGGGGDNIEEDEDIENPPASANDDKVEEAEVPKMARDPGQPSKLDRQIHKLTHCPYRSWCEHCVRGQAVGRQHKAIPIEDSTSEVPRVIIDYAFLHEDFSKDEEDG